MTPLLPADFIQPEPANKFAHLRINLTGPHFKAVAGTLLAKEKLGEKEKA